MKDQTKTKEQLANELEKMRQRVAKLEKADTERKQFGEELREYRDKLQWMFESASVGIVLTDLNGVITEVNDKGFQLGGFGAKSDLVGKNALETIASRDRERAAHDMQELLQKGGIGTRRYSLLKRDGSEFAADITAAVLRNAAGNISGFINTIMDCTERKQAEEALRESEEKLSLIFQYISDGIIVSDLEGKIIDENEAAVRLQGYSRKEEVIGRNGFKFIAEKDHARAAEDAMKSIETGYSPAYEYTFVDKTGREYDAEASASLLRGSSGNVVGFISIFRDITERKRAEEEKLKAIAERAAVIDAMGDGLLTMDMDGKILSVNSAMERISGYKENELKNKGAASLIPRFIKPDEQEELSAVIGSTLKGDIPGSKTLTFLSRNGQEIPISATASFILDEEGKPATIIVAFKDISNIKEAEEALRLSEEKYRTVLETMEEGYYEVDLDGNLTFFNDSLCRINGYPRDEMMGMNNRQYMDNETAKAVYKTFNRVYRTGEPDRSASWEVTKKDGTKSFVEGSVSLLRGPSDEPVGFRGIIRDITERKKAEIALKASEAKYRDLVERINDVIYSVDTNGVTTYISPVVESVLGYIPSELIGGSFADFMYQEDLKSATEGFLNTLSGNTQIGEFRIMTKSGEVRWVRSSNRPVFKEDRVIGVTGVITDITERKKAVEELRRMGWAVEATSDGVGIADADGWSIYHNKALVDLLGYSPEELNAAGGPTAVYADPSVARKMFNAIKKGGSWAGEVQMKTRDGHETSVFLRANSIKNTEGEIIGLVGLHTDITERKQAEEEKLKAVTERAAIIDAMGEGLVTVGMDGKMLSVNPAMERLSGYSKDEFINKDAFSLIPRFITPEEQEELTDMFIATLKGDEIHESKTFTFFNREGRELSLLWTTSLILDQEGKPAAILILFKDVTYIKQAEEALRKSEEKYRTVLETMEEGYYEVDLAGNLTFFNDSLCKINGYPRDEMMGMNNRQYMDNETAKAVYKTFNRVYRTGEPDRSASWEVTKKDGTKSFVEGSASLIRGPSGEPVGFRGVIRDITERRRAEEALQVSEKRFQDIALSSGDWIWEVDVNGKYAFASGRVKEILGYSPEELIGKTPFELMPEDEAKHIGQIFKKIAAKKEMIVDLENWNLTKNGELVCLLSRGVPMLDNAGSLIGYRGVDKDITERKKAEEERERLLHELEDKSKELEQLLFISSHDLRSPLVNIQGFAREMEFSLQEVHSVLDSDDTPSTVKEKLAAPIEEGIVDSLSYILASTIKIDTLLTGLLKLSRLGRATLTIEKLNMGELIAEVVDSFEFQAREAGVKLEVGRLPQCQGDIAQINQVFSNLIGNALKYLDPERPGILRISGRKEDNKAVYTVEDNGIGIAPEHQETVFQIFQRIDPEASSGEGLGLTIVRRILDRHGGEVWLDSEPGRGSRFHVSLPTGD